MCVRAWVVYNKLKSWFYAFLHHFSHFTHPRFLSYLIVRRLFRMWNVRDSSIHVIYLFPSLHTLFSMECSQNYLFSVRKLCFKQMEINFMESKSNSQSLTCAITLKCSLSAAVTSFESPENWVFATETAFILEFLPERRRRVKFSRVDLCKAEQTT